MRSSFIKLIIAALSIVHLGACVREPPGPAEQIGKGIDMITKGLEDIDQGETPEVKLERERLRKEQVLDQERRSRLLERERNPGYDYDRDHDTYESSSGDWSSKR